MYWLGLILQLKETLENLRRDVKEALSSEIISSNNRGIYTIVRIETLYIIM